MLEEMLGKQLDSIRPGESDSPVNHAPLRQLLDKLPVGAYICDANGLITYFNRNAEWLWGRAPKLNQSVDRYCGSHKLYSPDGSLIPHNQCWMAMALQLDKEFDGEEIVIEREDGARFTVLAHVSPLHDEKGRLTGAVNIVVDISDRKRADEAQARLAAIVESTGDSVIAADLDGKVITWNEGATRLYGFTAAEIMGKSINLLAPPERIDEWKGIFKQLEETGRIVQFDAVRMAKDGRRIDVSNTVSPVRDASGKMIAVSNITRDITIRRIAESAMQYSERRYRTLLEATAAVVWQTNAQGCFTVEQPVWAALTGQTFQEYRGLGWLNAVHPDDRGHTADLWQKAVADRTIFQSRARVKKNADYCHMLIRAVPIQDDRTQIREWIGSLTDISDTVRMREAAAASENRFRRLYESNQLSIFFYNADGRLTDPNDAFLNLIGVTRQDYDRDGLDWRKLTPPEWEEADKKSWHEIKQLGRCLPFEKEFYHKDGGRIPVLMSAGSLDAGNPDEGVALVFGVARMKETQAALRQREAELRTLNETLERRVQERTAEAESRSRQLRALALDLADTESRERKRLAQLLHDHFQQLVSAAKLKTGLVRRTIDDVKAIESLKQTENLLEQALTASRTLATELSPPLLNDAGLIPAMEWLVRKMEADYGLHITMHGDPAAEPESEQLRTLLFECARELLFNVVKHANTKEASVSITMSPAGLLSLVVADQGKGFDSLDLSAERRASEPSFGLFSIRERLGFIGGLLNITSAPGKGTQMELSVPVGVRAPRAPAQVEPEADFHRPPLVEILDRPARVLVADDHQLFREGMIHLLSQEPDLTVVGEAADGRQAVELTRKLKPDIVILDVSMPKLNGVHAAAQISRELPQTRIIGLSMHEDKDMAKAMRAAGAAVYLTKGGSSEKLLEVVRSLFTPKPRQ
jgi:PAS domain S-box-containing protein